jgi:hypothetical protein
MFKLAAAVIDFYDDPDFLSNKDAREIMGTALVEPDKVHLLRDMDFAVKIATAAGVHRKFPIYSKAATFLSGNYFDKIASELPEAIQKTAGSNLRTAHLLHGLPLPPSLKDPFEDPDTNLVEWRPDPDVVGTRSSEMVVKLAERVFMDRARSMTLLEKVAKAADLFKTAQVYGTEVTEQEVIDYAPKDDFGPYFRDMMQQRETLIKAGSNGILKEAFSQLLDVVVKTSVREIPFIVHQFDKIAGFAARYGKGIIDPFYGTWGGIAKEADKKEDLLKYKLETITRGDGADAILGTFGEQLASRFLRDPVGTYPTLRPAEKKFIDFLIDKIPSKVTPLEGEASPGKKQPSLWKQTDEATKDLKKEQTTPSSRPAEPFRYKSVTSLLEEGL